MKTSPKGGPFNGVREWLEGTLLWGKGEHSRRAIKTSVALSKGVASVSLWVMDPEGELIMSFKLVQVP